MPPLDKPTLSDKLKDESSTLSQFASTAFEKGIQRPVNGVAQLAEKLSGHSLPRLNIVDELNPGAPETNAQKAGDLAGALVSYAAARTLVKLTGLKTSNLIGSSALQGAATGALLGGVFTPVDDNKNFWHSRLSNATTDAGTFATLEGAGKALNAFKPLATTAESLHSINIAKNALRGALSGVPAGLVNSELSSLSSGHGFAKSNDVGESMKDYAIFGGAFGAMDGTITAARDIHKNLNTELSAKGESNNIPVNKGKYIGEGDEGTVYSNGDGTVTKVFKNENEDVSKTKAIFDRLRALGIRTPKIHEIGTTTDGQPAIRMEQIGNGNNLKEQLIFHELTVDDRINLRDEYYGLEQKLQKAGITIDWNLKNMRMQDGKLVVLDPSYVNEQPMSSIIVDMFASPVGQRPLKF